MGEKKNPYLSPIIGHKCLSVAYKLGKGCFSNKNLICSFLDCILSSSLSLQGWVITLVDDNRDSESVCKLSNEGIDIRLSKN